MLRANGLEAGSQQCRRPAGLVATAIHRWVMNPTYLRFGTNAYLAIP
jgi:hypothetical protein